MPAGQRTQRMHGVRLTTVTDLLGAGTGQCGHEFGVGQVSVLVPKVTLGVDQQCPDLTPRNLLRMTVSARQGSMLASLGSVVASPDSTERAAR